MAANQQKDVFPPAFCEANVSNYLLLHKKLHALSFQEISNRLKQIKIAQSPKSLSQKFNAGKLQAPLFLAILSVMGESIIKVGEFR